MPPETAAGEDAVRSAPTSTPEVTVLNLDVSRDIGKQVQGSAAIALNMIQNASSRGTEEAIGATCDTNPKEFRYVPLCVCHPNRCCVLLPLCVATCIHNNMTN